MSLISIIGLTLVAIGILISTILSWKYSSDSVNSYDLPVDIKNRVNSKWSSIKDKDEVFEMLDEIGKDRFNVGTDQLIRSILIIADNDKSKIRNIINSDYFGDPRDVIMKAMEKEGNTNDHGLSPFTEIGYQKPVSYSITPRKLDIYLDYLGDIDSFIKLGNTSEKKDISDEEWSIIDELVSDLILVKNAKTNSEYDKKIYDKIKSNCFDSYTIEKLEEVAIKIDSRDTM